MTVNTQAVHFSADRKLLEFIDKKLKKLSLYFERIHKAEVILRLENTGKIKAKIAEIKISLPGSVLFVKEQSKTFESSIDHAIEALKRQILRYKERANPKK